MRYIIKNIIKIILVIIIIVITVVFIDLEFKTNHNAIDGNLDLSMWDFKNRGAVNLNGQWEFYYNQLLSPEDFNSDANNKPKLTGYIKVPSSWSSPVGGEKIQGKAVGTYRLILSIKPSDEVFGIRISNVRMASKLFINGKMWGNSGEVGFSRKEYMPENKQYVVYLNNDTDKLEIIIQVANFDFEYGGITRNIIFGLQKDVKTIDTLINAFELSAALVMILLCFHYFSIYYIRQNDKSFLYASILLIFIAMSIATNREKILFEIFDEMPFEMTRKLQAYAANLFVIPLIYFFKAIRKELISKTLIRLVFAVLIPFTILITVSPYYIYSSYQSMVFSGINCFILTILINLIRAYLSFDSIGWNRNEIMVLIVFLLNIIGIFIFNILYSINIINSNIFTLISFLGLVASILIFLTYRFSAAYTNMEKMSEQLIKIDKLKDEFLAKTSHELKTPLHGIINISDALITGSDSNTRDNKDIILVKNIAIKLSSIVDDILDLTRLKNNNLLVESTVLDLKVCIDITLEVFKYIIQGKNIVIINEVKAGNNIIADEKRLRQVLFNLVNNAVKHTEKGYIKIWCKIKKNNVNIYIEDTGNGIPKHIQDNLFQAYEKYNSSGMGLGLHISRQLLERMNGGINLEWSEEGRGTRFEFYLPAGETSNTSYKSYKVNKNNKVINEPLSLDYYEGLNKDTILVVDDEISNIHVALKLLANENYNVISAISGEEALKKLKENRKIDLVLLDIMMPGISGIEVCRKIREEYSVVNLPVLLCTVRNSQQDFLIGFEAGANDFITKPFDSKEMKARIKTLITMKKSAKDALKSELAFLHAQIKPHFLYNAINTMVYFCYTDGEKAANLLTDFSKYLRLSFDIDASSEDTTIERELELVRAYVAIEKARFSDEISVEYDIDRDILNNKIPILTIQPIVENAIRHGLCKNGGKGNVRVTCRRISNKLLIKIEDNGIGISKELLEKLMTVTEKNQGVGFSNVKNRISRLAGGEFRVESKEGQGTTVTIILDKYE